MSILIGGLGGSGGGGGVEWFGITYFSNGWSCFDQSVIYLNSSGGLNSETSSTSASVGTSWSGILSVSNAHAAFLDGPTSSGTTIKIQGVFEPITTYTGDVEIHVMKVDKTGMGYGGTGSVSLTSIWSKIFTNQSAFTKLEIEETATVSFENTDRFTIVIYNKNTGVTVNIRAAVKLLGK